MTILYDATALLLRRKEPVMTGIDRVDFALAFTLAERSLQGIQTTGFLIKTRHACGVIDAWRMQSLLGKMLIARGIDQQPTKLLENLLTVLANPPHVCGQVGALRLRKEQRRTTNWYAEFGTAAHVFARAQSLSNFLRKSKWPIHYLHTSHYGFRHAGRFDWLKHNDIKTTFFIHDLIPIDCPQFCSDGASASLRAGIALAAKYATRIAVNSQSTAKRLQCFLREEDLREPEIEIHRLGAGILPGGTPYVANTMQTLMHPFFVCPGTIEGRKNVRVLLDAWRLMSSQRKPESVPWLVLAGQRGWNNADLLHDLDVMTDIAPYIIEVSGLNDVELASLSRLSSAVLVPSLAEGFSLSVAEALKQNVNVIASDIEVHREISRGQGNFVDPKSAPAWVSAVTRISRLKQDPFDREWSEFSSQLIDRLDN